MYHHNYRIPDYCWLIVSTGITVFLIGLAWSVSQASNYQLELANYKLAVGGALNDVAQASIALNEAAQSLPPKQRQKVKAIAAEASEAIETANDKLDVSESEAEVIDSLKE